MDETIVIDRQQSFKFDRPKRVAKPNPKYVDAVPAPSTSRMQEYEDWPEDDESAKSRVISVLSRRKNNISKATKRHFIESDTNDKLIEAKFDQQQSVSDAAMQMMKYLSADAQEEDNNVYFIRDDEGRIIEHIVAIRRTPATGIILARCQNCEQEHSPFDRPRKCCDKQKLLCSKCQRIFPKTNRLFDAHHLCFKFDFSFEWQCMLCGRDYVSRAALLWHRSRCESKGNELRAWFEAVPVNTIEIEDLVDELQTEDAESDSVVKPSPSLNVGDFQCDVCGQAFVRQSFLDYHRRTCGTRCETCNLAIFDVRHTDEEKKLIMASHKCRPATRYTTRCDECERILKNEFELIRHKNKDHGRNYVLEERVFNSFDDFNRWREIHQIETHQRYSGRKTRKRGIALHMLTDEDWCSQTMYNCARSQKSAYKKNSNQHKQNSTINIGEPCAAFIRLTVLKNGVCRALSMLVHNHAPQNDHARLPSWIKEEIYNLYLQVPSVSYVYAKLNKTDRNGQLIHESARPILRRDIHNQIRKYRKSGDLRLLAREQNINAIDLEMMTQFDDAYDDAAGIGEDGLPTHMPRADDLVVQHNFESNVERNESAAKICTSLSGVAADLALNQSYQFSDQDLCALRVAHDLLSQMNRLAKLDSDNMIRSKIIKEQAVNHDDIMMMQQHAINACHEHRHKTKGRRGQMKEEILAGYSNDYLTHDTAQYEHVEEVVHVEDESGEQYVVIDVLPDEQTEFVYETAPEQNVAYQRVID